MVSAYDMKSFSQLPPEQQVETWITEFSGTEYYNQKLLFMRTVSYFTQQDNVPVIKELLLNRLNDYELLPLNQVPRTFDMISDVLYSEFYYDLSTAEKNVLSQTIQRKLDDYVISRIIIDSTVIYYSCMIKRLQSDEKMKPRPEDENPLNIAEYYQKLGFPDIPIAWEQISQRYGINIDDLK